MFLFLAGGFSATFLQRLEKIFCCFRLAVDAVRVAVEKDTREVAEGGRGISHNENKQNIFQKKSEMKHLRGY